MFYFTCDRSLTCCDGTSSSAPLTGSLLVDAIYLLTYLLMILFRTVSSNDRQLEKYIQYTQKFLFEVIALIV